MKEVTMSSNIPTYPRCIYCLEATEHNIGPKFRGNCPFYYETYNGPAQTNVILDGFIAFGFMRCMSDWRPAMPKQFIQEYYYEDPREPDKFNFIGLHV
jgi:hypothetical protein